MAIEVTCNSCQHEFKVPDKFSGHHGRCPKCKAVVRAPVIDDFEILEEGAERSHPAGQAVTGPLASDDWHLHEGNAPSAAGPKLPPPPAPPLHETQAEPTAEQEGALESRSVPVLDVRVAKRRLRRASSGSLDALAESGVEHAAEAEEADPYEESAPAESELAAQAVDPMAPVSALAPSAPAEPEEPTSETRIKSRRKRRPVEKAISKSRRRRKKKHGDGDEDDETWPDWVWQMIVVAALVVLLLGLILVTVLTGGLKSPPAQPGTSVAGGGDSPAPDTTPDPAPREAAAPPPVTLPPRMREEWPALREALVDLEFGAGTQRSKLRAIVIDPNGLLVVHYHRLLAVDPSQASVDVQGVSLPLEGVVAASRELNLVILKLELAFPVDLEYLELAKAEPAIGDTLYAASRLAGSPNATKELTPLEVAGIMPTANLPRPERMAMLAWGEETGAPLTWIETTQPPPGSARGGPLLDAEGHLVGVVTQLDPDSPCGYAILSQHVAELLAHAREEALPLNLASLAELEQDLAPPEEAEPDESGDEAEPGEEEAEPGESEGEDSAAEPDADPEEAPLEQVL